jgi:hypothetical protein
MAARDVYNTSVSNAESAKAATIFAANTTFQEAINASGVNVGYTLQSGSYSSLATAIANANASRAATRYAAEQLRQATIALARDTLRNASDNGPF